MSRTAKPRPSAWLWLCCLMAAAPLHAAAHAVLVGSSLADTHTTAANQATTVSLQFNSHIELNFVTVDLVDVNDHTTALEIHDGKRPGAMRVELPALAPGVYALRYHVVARDGHLTDGEIEFTAQP